MSKKKNKFGGPEKVWYLVQQSDDEGDTWWSEGENIWTVDPLRATGYLGSKQADKVIKRFNCLLNGYNTIDGISRDEVMDNIKKPRITYSPQEEKPTGFLIRKVKSLESNSKLNFGFYWSEENKTWTSSKGNATVYPAENLALVRVGRLLREGIVTETVPLELEDLDPPKTYRPRLSPATVIIDRTTPDFPIPLFVADVDDDGTTATVVAEGFTSDSDFTKERMEDILALITRGEYQVLWDPVMMKTPESNKEFLLSIGAPKEEFNIVVPGCILLGPGNVPSDDIPYMVDKIIGDDVLLLHPGLNGHKLYSTDDVRADILDGHWKVIYDPRIGSDQICEDDKVP
jgi:hypothetical protein